LTLFMICAFCNTGGVQVLNPKFLNSTVLISFDVDDTSSSVATGFFVLREFEDGVPRVFLVTNNHVLPKEGKKKSVTIRVNTGNGDKVEVGQIEIPIVGEDGKYLPSVRLHPRRGFDVAAVHVTQEFMKHDIKAAQIPYSLFVTKDKLEAEKITIGDEIFLLGYPDAIYDPRNVWPILRVGVISSVPSEGYAFDERLRRKYHLPDQIDGFLIDANVFPGSSGSLVILKPQPFTTGPQGEALSSNAKKTPYLLGIISGSIPIEDKALSSRQRMGLGIVYSADTIKETIERFHH